LHEAPGGPRIANDVRRHWLQLTLIAWALITIWLLYDRWGSIQWLSLGDTDDNMRLMQVRALLHGQGWYDLRQYRMNPPQGFDIHWSRLVDLPIAGLILFFRLFVTNAEAERLACGLAPLLPLSLAMIGLSATVRRVVHPLAWPVALVFLFTGCTATMLMFMPERIDHHGWQLAMLSLTVAGLADTDRRRGGAIVGLSSAVSLTIGLEMLPYAAIAGAILALRWIWDRGEAPRLAVYALTLAGGSALGFALFASNANQVARCDALTPVWLSVMVEAGALLFVLAWFNPTSRVLRLVLSAVAGAAIGVAFATIFPQCLGRPEQVSPELAREWLDNVREAKPVFSHPLRMSLPIVALPIVGLVGGIWATWRARHDRALLQMWVTVLLFATSACALMVWQTREGPAAELLAVPGAVALAWIILSWTLAQRSVLVRVIGSVVGFLAASGVLAIYVMQWLPIDKPTAFVQRVNTAGARCPTIPAMAPLDRYPAQTVFTFVDLGPRLITLTHHDAVAGPYHRNGDAILDVQHAFKGSADNFRAIAKKHNATLLLICPNMAESTVYRSRAPGGFYDQLAHNQLPDWLTPLPLPKKSPLRLFQIH
jgi:hypothetical protein